MSPNDEGLLSRPRQSVRTGKQTLVVRPTDQDTQLETLERLRELEVTTGSLKEDLAAIKSTGDSRKFDTRTIVALLAIALSVAGYVIQDARNTSRQDAELEMTKTRVGSIERVVNANTESRIRMEMELKTLQEGQEEIKRLLERHDGRTRKSMPAAP